MISRVQAGQTGPRPFIHRTRDVASLPVTDTHFNNSNWNAKWKLDHRLLLRDAHDETSQKGAANTRYSNDSARYQRYSFRSGGIRQREWIQHGGVHQQDTDGLAKDAVGTKHGAPTLRSNNVTDTSMTAVYDCFGKVPSHIAPSVPVRHWDQGLLAGAVTFALTYPSLVWLGYQIPGPDLEAVPQAIWGGAVAALHYATLGASMHEQARSFIETLQHPWQSAWRLGGALAGSLALTVCVLRHTLTPRSNTWHLKGPRLLEGKEALAECRRRSLTPKQIAEDPGHLAIHPALVLPKKHVGKHSLIHGSVGSGKTQVLFGIIHQIIGRDDKLFLLDVKGDMAAKFRRPIIVSPFDARSYVWDVAKDVRTPSQAAAFAASIIPEDQGSGKFWTIAARQVFTGAIRYLQNEKADTWTWPDLSKATARSAQDMLPMLQEHYAKAAPLIANVEGQSTTSILATLAGFTRVVDDLALAWPTVGKRSFSITQWIKDDYKGRKQVIVQSGPDETLTRAYISAMINVAVPEIISPSLPDNEHGRFIGFIFDELASIGRINLGPLIDKGRSKGVVVIAGLQDLAQLRRVYGNDEAMAISGMVGTHIICQVQMGETRDTLAQQLGKHKVAYRTHDANAQVHEESRALVSNVELTDRLGFHRGKSFGAHRWGIRAIVQMGGDPLLLDFPGIEFPDKREGQVRAKWTTRPAGRSIQDQSAFAPPQVRSPSDEELRTVGQTEGLTEEQINELFKPE